ncbi:hypothetical protein PIB30_068940 [Stylosanthes scabra]|uniref:Triacylglycerol lipase n=1 Tax=Stylosanthes scabra TaxID=79078 RepID=A0ABU6WR09_9FABA|nr:hypothetical protein [Stylosanthes scabra]
MTIRSVASKFLEGICSNLKLNCSDLMTVFTVIRTGKIAMYDYADQEQNILHYGQASPPLYDMGSIPNGFPLFLSYGGKDLLSDVKDVQLLLTDLKDHDKNKLVVLFIEDYAHADFVMGVNAKQIVYDPIMAFFHDN